MINTFLLFWNFLMRIFIILYFFKFSKSKRRRYSMVFSSNNAFLLGVALLFLFLILLHLFLFYNIFIPLPLSERLEKNLHLFLWKFRSYNNEVSFFAKKKTKLVVLLSQIWRYRKMYGKKVLTELFRFQRETPFSRCSSTHTQ